MEKELAEAEIEITRERLEAFRGEARKLPPDPNLINEAVSYYQGANYLFEHNLNKF
jgi:hypothetical protein